MRSPSNPHVVISSLQTSSRMLVYRNTHALCFPKLLGYLIPSKRPAKIVSILHSRNHYVPSFFLLLYNSKNLRIWYSDSLQIAILACDKLVLDNSHDPKILTQNQYHALQELSPWPSTEYVRFIAPMSIIWIAPLCVCFPFLLSILINPSEQAP